MHCQTEIFGEQNSVGHSCSRFELIYFIQIATNKFMGTQNTTEHRQSGSYLFYKLSCIFNYVEALKCVSP